MTTHVRRGPPRPRASLLPVAATAAAALVAALAACVPAKKADLRPTRQPAAVELCTPGPCRDSVELVYLGVGGFVLRAGEAAVMTAPSFTHRRLSLVVLNWWLPTPDTAKIGRLLDSVAVPPVDAILVGHGHYDHLLDVPAVARRMRGARVYGSETVKLALAGDPFLRDSLLRDSARVVDVGARVGTAFAPGTWTYVGGGRMRFMPLRSSHAPNWWRLTIAPGDRREPATRLPRHPWGWRAGPTYAYLIDVLDSSGAPAFRVFYQDAASEPLHAFPPPFEGRDSRAVDLAILSVGNYGKVPGYPAVPLAATRPRHVVLGHWENFFRAVDDTTTVVPRTNTGELVAILEEAVGKRWTTPERFARMTFRY